MQRTVTTLGGGAGRGGGGGGSIRDAGGKLGEMAAAREEVYFRKKVRIFWQLLVEFHIVKYILIFFSHKLLHTNFMIFLSFPVLVTRGHISEIPPPSVTSHILQFIK